jgi:unsaturated chondroitin disaccharide hydrolase
MNTLFTKIFIILTPIISNLLVGHENSEKPLKLVIKESLDLAMIQYTSMAAVLKDSVLLLPKTADRNGNLITCTSSWWTSGFFPGSLWYLYEYSGDETLKNNAELYSTRVENQKYTTNNHDVGFILMCSFGNGLRITGNDSYKEVLLHGANSLAARFRKGAGVIQSWDIAPWNEKNEWQCPVIIDNMMNLELLAEATKLTGDSSFHKIATSHADATLKNHFRSNFSSYHVVDYNTIDGSVRKKQTHQGYSDGSSWARGQSWGLYGYTMMYRETRCKRYIDQACHIADFLIGHPNLPEDKIPYWDYNAPDIPNAYRDASAGAIMCAALIELSEYVDKSLSVTYLKIAEQQIRSLSSPEYIGRVGENAGFILKHSVGSLPGKSEVDVPLIYADYYFIEALMRYKRILK